MKNTMYKVLCALLVCVMLLGMLPTTALATEAQAELTKVKAWNLVLADEIAVNFYVSISGAAEDAVMKITDGYGTAEYPVATAKKNADGNYLFTARLAAAQMADSITLQLISGEEEGPVHTYCAAKYAATVLSGEYKQSTKDLVLAMINYGAAAQTYFGYHTENLANAGFEAAPTAQIPAVSGSKAIGNVQGISWKGNSLLLQSRTAVRYYFAAENIDAYTFCANGVAYTPVEKDGLYYVDVPGINPQDYDKEIALQVTDGTDTLTVCYSPVAYISRQYAKSSNEAMVALVHNLYQYHIAAEDYLKDGGSSNVTTDGNGIVTEQVIISGENSTAVVAEGTQLEADTTTLTLSVAPADGSDADVDVAADEKLVSMDVHVEGIAKGNTVPVLVTLNELAPEFLNKGNVALYHVENGVTVEMTRVYSDQELDAHNEYYYDIVTGTVTIAVASFSTFAVKSTPAKWQGQFDYSWYNKEAAEFAIYNADQLAGLGAIVGGMNNQAQDNFSGKTVKLMADINIGDLDSENGIVFYPIGYYNNTGSYDKCSGKVTVDGQEVAVVSNVTSFKGTFDGNGHTISNLYQNGWAMGADYSYSMAGGGLFASIVDADIKNLTMANADIVMECVDMGVVVGYANGNCNFENIIIKDSTIQNYNRCTGGVIGEIGGGGSYTLTNVDVNAGTTISALWGTFDPPMGGLIGGKWGEAGTRAGRGTEVQVTMKNCDVACKLDAYNDVTSAYQWYSYRRSGMLIGDTEQSKTVNGRTEATAEWLTTQNCTVSYGDWAKYTYCQFSDTTSMAARYPWVRAQAGLSNSSYSNARYGRPAFADKTIDWENHTDADHKLGDAHHVDITFHQLYGGGQGCYGGNSHVGNGVTEIAAPTAAAKFAQKEGFSGNIVPDTTLTLGEIFMTVNSQDVPEIQVLDVIAFVSPVNEEDTVRASFYKHPSDWTQSTLTFTGIGKATITINDYYYCEPTTITVNVAEKTFVPGYYKVTDTSEILSGGQFVIVAEADGYHKALGTKVNTETPKNKIPAIAVTVVDDQVQPIEGQTIPMWTIEAAENGFYLYNGNRYLKYSGSTDITTTDDAYSWKITKIDGKDVFTIDSQTDSRALLYRSTLDLFGGYSTTNIGAETEKYFNEMTLYKWYDAPDCDHDYVATEEVVVPTCTEDGYTVYTCSICGAETKMDVVAAIGHTEEIVEGYAATCTENGLTDGVVCSVCDAVITEQTAIAAAGHSYDAVVTPPTATEQGYTTHTCSACDATYVDSFVPALGVSYTVSFVVPNGVGKIEDMTCNSDGITLPEAGTIEGYTFIGWAEEKIDEGTTIEPTVRTGSFVATKNTTFYAVYSYSAGGIGTVTVTWNLVTDASDLKADDKIVIVAKDYNYALSTTQNNNNRGQATVTKEGTTVTFGEDVQIITLKAGTTAGTFEFYTGSGYLYAASSSSNHLKTQATNNANGSWKIEIAASGVATIKAQGSNTRNWLRYNASNNPPIFSCYGSGQTDVSIYKETTGTSEQTYYTTNICAHSNTTETTVDATCTEAGSITVTCDDCGKIIDTVVIPVTDHKNTTTNTVDATCTKDGSITVTCDDCGKTISTEVIKALGHNYVAGECTVCHEQEPTVPSVPVEATLSFASTAQRTFFSTSMQIWEQNGITFTNNKSSSTNNVADYTNPVRLYANSSLVIEAEGSMTKIIFDCNNSSYATTLKNSIGTVAGATVKASSDKVTVEFANAMESFTIAKITAQVRMDSITVTYLPSK